MIHGHHASTLSMPVTGSGEGLTSGIAAAERLRRGALRGRSGMREAGRRHYVSLPCGERGEEQGHAGSDKPFISRFFLNTLAPSFPGRDTQPNVL